MFRFKCILMVLLKNGFRLNASYACSSPFKILCFELAGTGVTGVMCSQQYGLDITDMNQVLLVSHVKKLGPAGRPPPGPALLVPELCYLTGEEQPHT